MKNEVEERDGYRIIKRGDIRINTSPIDCSLCCCVAIDELDVTSITRSNCCYDCEIEIADPNRKMWLAGWRPDAAKIIEIISKRLASSYNRAHI